jgi:hypothetical protein
LNADTGVITIETTAAVQAQVSYTIEATPTNIANYRGVKEATANIEITQKSIAGYTLTYADTSVGYSVGGSITPTTSPFPTGASRSYRRTGGGPFPTGIQVSLITPEIGVGVMLPPTEYPTLVTA